MEDTCLCGLIPANHPECPRCHEKQSIIPILYGLPNLDAIQLERDGKLELGSRFYKIGAPCWRCKSCEFAFGID
ncbi:MAG: hypothetical protein ACYDH1_05895 [Anaerolineaceae bacterium]|nr:MAG: hypothetical protein CVU46_07555 [Chloroflexi bacterium HGW-Chloroflexi-8]